LLGYPQGQLLGTKRSLQLISLEIKGEGLPKVQGPDKKAYPRT